MEKGRISENVLSNEGVIFANVIPVFSIPRKTTYYIFHGAIERTPLIGLLSLDPYKR